jgi:hypothetical protein
MNNVRTLTEHFKPEHLVQVRVNHLLEQNINVQVQVRAQDPRTQTKPNPGQSNLAPALKLMLKPSLSFSPALKAMLKHKTFP